MSIRRSIALVGAGYMGRGALRILLNDQKDATFLVIDRDPENLKNAQALDPKRIHAQLIDVLKVRPPFRGIDVVVNLAGPFFCGRDDVARAAIADSAAYVDVCDDVEGTYAVLALDEEARRANVPILTGAGNSPGVANWLSCRLLKGFPGCDGLKIVWVVQEADPGGLAVLRHMLHMAVTPCPIWKDGFIGQTNGFVPETAEIFSVPEPFGTIEAYDTAHPEPVTLARRFPHLRLIQCKGSLSPQWANRAFSTLGRIGFGRSDLNVSVKDIRIDPAEYLWRLLWARHNSRASRQREAHTMINVIGLEGSKTRVMHTIVDDADMSRGTGLGVAAACIQLMQSGATSGASGVEMLETQPSLDLFFRLARGVGAFSRGVIEREFP